jgi:hypothetical protein
MRRFLTSALIVADLFTREMVVNQKNLKLSNGGMAPCPSGEEWEICSAASADSVVKQFQ